MKRIITHPRIWPYVSDDFAGEPETWRPLENPGIWYVLVREAAAPAQPDEVRGLFTFLPQNAICWEVHTALLPSAWRTTASEEIARELLQWVWRETPCQRIVTNVPGCNTKALEYAEKCGMKQFGINNGSYQKDGRLHDQILLGISRPQETSRRQEDRTCH